MSMTKHILQSRLADKAILKEDLLNLKGGNIETNAANYGLNLDYYPNIDVLNAAIRIVKLERELCKKANKSNGDGIW